MALEKPRMVSINMRAILKLHYFAFILTPQWVFVQTPLVFSSQHSNVRVVIRSRDFLSNELLNPKLVVVNYRVRALYDDPLTLVVDCPVRHINFVLHCAFINGPRYQTRIGLLSRDRGLIRLLHLNEDDCIQLMSLSKFCMNLANCQEIISQV